METLYDILKVRENAPPEAIKAAYKTLSSLFHPDKNPDDAVAAQKMQQVNNAYHVLRDPRSRALYAETLRRARTPKPLPVAQEDRWTPKRVFDAFAFIHFNGPGAQPRLHRHGDVRAWMFHFLYALGLMTVGGIIAAVALSAYQNSARSAAPAAAAQPASPYLPQPAQGEGNGWERDAKVNALRAAIRNGQLKVIDTGSAPPAQASSRLGHWPASDVQAVQASQTWWMEGGIFALHIANRTPYKANQINYGYAPLPCGQAATDATGATHRLHLSEPLLPGQEAVVAFYPDAGMAVTGNGCLMVEDILG